MQPLDELFQMLQECLSPPETPHSPRCVPDDLDALLSLATQQRVLEIIIGNILSLPAEIRQRSQKLSQLHLTYTKQIAGNIMRQDAGLMVIHRLRQALGVPVILLKGPVLSLCYPNPDSRTARDLDIFVDKAHMEKALAFFRAEGFSLSDEPVSHHYLCTRQDTGLIELHTDLFGEASKNKLFGPHASKDLLAMDTLPFAYGAYQMETLNPTGNLSFIIMHAAKHFIFGRPYLRQLLDILMFARAYGGDVNWPLLWEMLDDANLSAWASCVFVLGRQRLDLPYPTGKPFSAQDGQLIDSLLAHLLKSRVWDEQGLNTQMHRHLIRDEDTSRIRHIERSKWHYYIRLLCPPVHSLEPARYGYAHRFRMLLPVAWVHRLCHWLLGNRGGLSQALREGEIIHEALTEEMKLLRQFKLMRDDE